MLTVRLKIQQSYGKSAKCFLWI